MAQCLQAAVTAREPHEPAVATPRHVLEEHALDGIVGAEIENLVEPGLKEGRYVGGCAEPHSAILASR